MGVKSFASLRRLTQRLRWGGLDLADRLFVRGPVERAAVRRLSGAKPSADTPVMRVYVDISVIHKHDAGTGIQRVVRSIRDHLPHVMRDGVRLEPVVVRKLRDGYVTMDGAPLTGAPGSVFLGLDFATDAVFRSRRALHTFRQQGGRIWFVVHDALPLTHPQWFTAASCIKYRRWLRTCAALADGFFCVSPVVAEQLAGLLEHRFGRSPLPEIVTITPGSNITQTDLLVTPESLPQASGLDADIVSQAVVMVGTLEPRKGHTDVLDAFDLLWGQGLTIPLVLIGRAGWNTAALQRRILAHAHLGRRLFWLDDVDDQALHASYRFCRLAVVPSLAEGYGLPLDEALALGAPVLARDIPVFQRHQGEPVTYFDAAADASAIAAAVLKAWSNADGQKRVLPLRTWDETAQQIVRALGCSVDESVSG